MKDVTLVRGCRNCRRPGRVTAGSVRTTSAFDASGVVVAKTPVVTCKNVRRPKPDAGRWDGKLGFVVSLFVTHFFAMARRFA